MQNRRYFLAERTCDELLQTTVNGTRGRNIFAPFEDAIGSAVIADEPAGLADEQDPRRRTPRVEIILPETIHSPRRDPRKVQCGRTEAANTSNVRPNGAIDFCP